MERDTALSSDRVNDVPPRLSEAAVVIPKVFHVCSGASSSYWPRTSCEKAGRGRENNRLKMDNSKPKNFDIFMLYLILACMQRFRKF